MGEVFKILFKKCSDIENKSKYNFFSMKGRVEMQKTFLETFFVLILHKKLSLVKYFMNFFFQQFKK